MSDIDNSELTEADLEGEKSEAEATEQMYPASYLNTIIADMQLEIHVRTTAIKAAVEMRGLTTATEAIADARKIEAYIIKGE